MKELLLGQVREVLDEHGLEYEVIECDPDLADTAAFCEAYGYEPSQSANTILVASRKVEPTKYAACVVLAIHRLDVNKVVVKQMGIKKASFADGETTKKLTGMEIGGVTAPGITDLPIYVDSDVMNVDKIILGGGNRTSKILLDPKELEKLPNVLVIQNLAKIPE